MADRYPRYSVPKLRSIVTVMASTEPSRRGMSKLHLDDTQRIAHSEITASIASNSEMSSVEPGAGKILVSKKDKPTGGVKLKKSIAKKTKPKDAESNGELRPDQCTFNPILTFVKSLQE